MFRKNKLHVIGKLIKGGVLVLNKLVFRAKKKDDQYEVLYNLLNTAKTTAFGLEFNFQRLLKSKNIKREFARNIPISDYHSLHENWWVKIHNGAEDVTWPGMPHYFALSSGTTGNVAKKIPVTDEMLKSFRKAGVRQIAALAEFDLPPEFFEKDILMLGSSTDLSNVDGHLEGEISGINTSNIPFWFKRHYKPGEEIANISDFDEKIQRIAEESADWDVGAISGIPSWVELMMKKVIEYNRADDIHDVWPNLAVFTSGGVAFEPYETSFNSLLKHPIKIINTYVASEGFIAFQANPKTNNMELITDCGIYYEFARMNTRNINEDGSLKQTVQTITLENVRENIEYVLVVSSCAGLWRYTIGDTIKFTNVERNEIQITGRTKFFLNVVGSQLSVNKMDVALKELSEVYNLDINEYTVCAKRIKGKFYHCWYLGTNSDVSESKLAEQLDALLKLSNKNYKVARSKALKGVKVKTISPQVFYNWNEKNKKKGGQVKTARVMKEEVFLEFEKFIEGEKS